MRNDQELIAAIRNNEEILTGIYKGCKSKAMGFLMAYFGDFLTEDERLQIYHEAMLAFYELAVKEGFQLKKTIQSTINSICRNIGYLRLRENGTFNDFNTELTEEQLADFDIDLTIDSVLERSPKMTALEEALDKAFHQLRETGGNCFQLLHDYWYHNFSDEQLAEKYHYADPENARMQKARCQKRLKDLAEQFLTTV